MKKYLVKFGYGNCDNPAIYEVEVTKETPKRVYFERTSREPLMGGGRFTTLYEKYIETGARNLVDTPAEAFELVIADIQSVKESREKQVADYRAQLDTVKAIARSTKK